MNAGGATSHHALIGPSHPRELPGILPEPLLILIVELRVVLPALHGKEARGGGGVVIYANLGILQTPVATLADVPQLCGVGRRVGAVHNFEVRTRLDDPHEGIDTDAGVALRGKMDENSPEALKLARVTVLLSVIVHVGLRHQRPRRRRMAHMSPGGRPLLLLLLRPWLLKQLVRRTGFAPRRSRKDDQERTQSHKSRRQAAGRGCCHMIVLCYARRRRRRSRSFPFSAHHRPPQSAT